MSLKRKKLITVFRYILFLGVGILLLYLAFKGQDLDLIVENLKNANYFWVTASLAVMLLAHLVRAIRWRMLIRPLGYLPRSSNVYHAVIIGYLANLALPRMGEVTRCGILNRTDKVPVNALVGTVITERAIDAFSLLLITLLALLLQFEVISGFIVSEILPGFMSRASTGWLLILLLAFAVVCWMLMRYFFKKYRFRLLRMKIVRKTILLLAGFRQGLTTIARIKHPSLFWLLTISMWACYLMAVYFGFNALPATYGLSLGIAVVTLVLGSLGMIMPVQAGIGPYHWAVTEGLMLFGISRAAALTYAAISHTSSQILLILVVGSVSMLAVFWKQLKKESGNQKPAPPAGMPASRTGRQEVGNQPLSRSRPNQPVPERKNRRGPGAKSQEGPPDQ